VHHVALAIPTETEQTAAKLHLEGLGYTDVSRSRTATISTRSDQRATIRLRVGRPAAARLHVRWRRTRRSS
jgi:hypothetical protein